MVQRDLPYEVHIRCMTARWDAEGLFARYSILTQELNYVVQEGSLEGVEAKECPQEAEVEGTWTYSIFPADELYKKVMGFLEDRWYSRRGIS